MIVSLWLALQEVGQDIEAAAPAHDHYCADSGSESLMNLKINE